MSSVLFTTSTDIEYLAATIHFSKPRALGMYAPSVAGKGAALQNCFGFVAGTVRPVTRPDEHQRLLYSGHKWVHALKFQSVVLPNGLIANRYGPIGKDEFQLAIIYK